VFVGFCDQRGIKYLNRVTQTISKIIRGFSKRRASSPPRPESACAALASRRREQACTVRDKMKIVRQLINWRAKRGLLKVTHLPV